MLERRQDLGVQLVTGRGVCELACDVVTLGGRLARDVSNGSGLLLVNAVAIAAGVLVLKVMVSMFWGGWHLARHER